MGDLDEEFLFDELDDRFRISLRSWSDFFLEDFLVKKLGRTIGSDDDGGG